MKKKEFIKKESLYLIYFSIIGRILILIKDILIAGKVGVCCEMDNYVLALNTIMVPTRVVADGIIISMIPLLQIIREEKGEGRRLDYTNNFFNISLVMSMVLMAIAYVLAPSIISLLGPGLEGNDLNETITLFRIGLPIILVSGFRAVTAGYLQSEHAFRAGAKGLVTNPLIFIIYLLVFANIFATEGIMLKGLMATRAIAIFSQGYLLYRAMVKGGFKYKWKFDLKDKYLKKILGFLIPVVAGFGINEVNIFIDNAIASTLATGSISELNYANDIINLFLGIFVAAIVTVIFPTLSESHKKDEIGELRKGIKYGVKVILTFAIPVSIGLIVLSRPIVRLLFQRGAFDIEATFFTAQALSYLGIGFMALTFIPLITRAYYSIHEMKTPFFIGLLILVANLFLNLLLGPKMGAAGIALATSLSSTLFVVLGFYGLKKRLRE